MTTMRMLRPVVCGSLDTTQTLSVSGAGRAHLDWKLGIGGGPEQQAANWLGMRLVSWGAKPEKFGSFAKRQSAPTNTMRRRDRQLSKLSPHH
jgi:hypothetical protein